MSLYYAIINRLRIPTATSTCFCSSAIIAAASSASLIARIANEQPPFLKLVKAYFLQSASPNVIKHPPHRLIVTIACLVQAAMLPPSRTVAPFRRNESRKADKSLRQLAPAMRGQPAGAKGNLITDNSPYSGVGSHGVPPNFHAALFLG